jgi:hypothetical protein
VRAAAEGEETFLRAAAAAAAATTARRLADLAEHARWKQARKDKKAQEERVAAVAGRAAGAGDSHWLLAASSAPHSQLKLAGAGVGAGAGGSHRTLVASSARRGQSAASSARHGQSAASSVRQGQSAAGDATWATRHKQEVWAR